MIKIVPHLGPFNIGKTFIEAITKVTINLERPKNEIVASGLTQLGMNNKTFIYLIIPIEQTQEINIHNTLIKNEKTNKKKLFERNFSIFEEKK